MTIKVTIAYPNCPKPANELKVSQKKPKTHLRTRDKFQAEIQNAIMEPLTANEIITRMN